jgi:two-component system, LytTR family, sensor kinase
MRAKLINIFSHVAGWVFFFSLVVGFMANSPNSPKVTSQLLSVPFLVFYTVFLFLFYFNMLVLIPQLYIKKRYIIYFLVIAILFVAVYFIRPFDGLMKLNPPPGEMNKMPPPDGGPKGSGGPGIDITSFILFITVWSLSTAICIIRQWRVTEQRALQAETDKVNAELSFLKSQVNPHFLFNTLNNIYSLAVTKNENTAPSIMKLSNIMRYVTDEAGQDYVSLDSEVECMRDYIDLQRMRLGETMNVDFAVNGNTMHKKITPLILMTFVENVFKYGISSHEPSDIIIKLSADEQTITFFCQNKLFETKQNVERTGIGIPNARKRLLHLYLNKHFLDIDTGNGLFTVQLTLQA